MRRPVLDELADAELVTLTRDGDPRAYGELWLRHAAAAHVVARSFTSFDADDVVAEGFARVLASIRGGNGPVAGFRACLIVAVKNVARDWGRRDVAITTPDLELLVDTGMPTSDEAALAALEQGVTATAFRSLPTRWQEALWYSEVDELKPREFAHLLGIAPNAASALLVRARRALRDAWVAGHLRRASSPECQAVLEQLGAHSRGVRSSRRAAQVEAHLAECPTCAIAWEEAQTVASRLALVLLPLAAGVSGAAAYAAWVQHGGAVAASAAPVAASPAAGPGPAARARLRPSSQGALVAAGAVAATVLAVGVVFGVTALVTAPTSAPVATVAAPAPPSPAPPVEVPDEPAPLPAPPIIVPAPVPPAASDDQPDPGGDFGPGVDPGAGTEPGGDADPPPPASPTAPTFVVDVSAGPLLYPRLTGTDALPGAVVEILDESGAVVARAIADDTGAWSVDDFSGGACATAPDAYLPPGIHELQARQLVDGLASPLSTQTAIVVAPAPVFLSPLDMEALPVGTFTIAITGVPGAQVQRIKLPDEAPCRPTPMVLDESGAFSEVFTLPDAGPIVLGLRYFDPLTGRHGPATFARIELQ